MHRQGCIILLKGLGLNVWAGLRMALFLRVEESSLCAGPGSALVLLGLHLLAKLTSEWISVGSVGEWSAGALPDAMFPIALGFVAACLIAGLSGKPQKLLLSMVMLLAASFPILGLGGLVGMRLKASGETDLAFFASVGCSVWTALAVAKAAAGPNEIKGGRSVALSAILILVLAVPSGLVDPAASGLWRPSEEDTYEKKYDALTEEAAFYRQPKIFNEALAKLRKHSHQASELYFLGFGGDADQEVFAKEVLAVEKIIGQRFDASARAVSLVNSYHTALDYPVASVTALRRSIMSIGEAMDKDRDILFLFITSHGYSDHEIALEFWPLRFAVLNPEVLRGILDESGIKWRVVVISACYSGGFIEPLRKDDTIVITSAAADKSSFGCDDLNDWTYFGKAFFADALRKENDLAKAFDEAKQSIARREQEENVDVASEPGIFLGPAMNAKWHDFLKQNGFDP